MSGTDNATRLVPTAVTRNLYDALMDARAYVRLASLETSTVFTAAERALAVLHLEATDGALAEAADHLQGER